VIYNIESAIEHPDEMPVCPLCGNDLQLWEPVVLVTAFGTKGLAHSYCVQSFGREN
jgi:hypothetical protein